MESKQWYNSKDKLPKQGQNIIPKINGREYPAIIFDGRMSEKFEAENVQWCESIEYSPTPQVQSGLSAEEVALAKYPVTYKTQFGQLDFDLNGYERDFYREGYQDALEYAASKVAEATKSKYYPKDYPIESRDRVLMMFEAWEKGKHDEAMHEYSDLVQAKVAEKEREIERLKQELEENIKMSKVWKDAYEKAHKGFWGLV